MTKITLIVMMTLINRSPFEIENVVELIEMNETSNKNIEFEAFVEATFNYETGYGSSWLWKNQNNAGGIKCGSKFCTYDTQEQGLSELRALLEVYYNKYGNDFKTIRSVYTGYKDKEKLDKDYKIFMELYEKAYERINNNGKIMGRNT